MPDDEPSPVEIALSELAKSIDKNGQLSVQEWRKTMATGMQVVIQLLAPLPDRVERLERKNLLMLIEKHPLIAVFCVGLFFFVLELWHSQVWRPWLKALGIPMP